MGTRNKKGKKRRILLFFSSPILLGFFLSVLFVKFKEIPSPLALDAYEGMSFWELSTTFYGVDGKPFAEFGPKKRKIVPLEKIPSCLSNAVIAIEDKRFYKHKGIDIKSIIRAFISNIKAGSIKEGGSTITQQLSRALFLTPSRTIWRKINETLLAFQIERHYTKEEILERYLNKVYFGHGNYGVEMASKFYFGKDVENITLEEAALLAGLIRAPNFYSPFINEELCRRRTQKVLNAMARCGFITFEEAERAKMRVPSLIKEIRERGRIHFNEAPFFVEHIRRELEEKYGEFLYKGGLQIYTTCDVRMQKIAEELLSSYLKSLNEMLGKKEGEKIEGALVAIEPETGFVKVMVGGSSFSANNQLNRVVQARRQPGSAFKPFLYLAAIEEKMSPATIVHDSPLIFLKEKKEDKEEFWIPQNYGGQFYGPVTLRRALELSLNVASVRLAQMVTPKKIAEYAKKCGIEEKLYPDLSLTLGTSEVTPLSMCSAFSTFANGGVWTKPLFIRYIKDKNGEIIEERESVRKRVISEQAAYIITYMLQGVIERGTGQAARLPRPCAGKTGTTNDFCDAWFVGYTPQLCAAVWIGFDKGRISLGEGNTGGRIAAPLWAAFMKKALEGEEVKEFKVPEGIKFLKIDPETGALATEKCPKVFLEAFIEGTEPQHTCSLHSEEVRGNL